MKDKYQALTHLWLAKAGDDLLWAKASFKDGFYAGACFIAQQVAEKVLKAYLFSKHQKLIRTHILPRLLKRCVEFDRLFEELEHGCEILTYYYTEARYPDDVDTSAFDNKEKAEEAIEWAERIFEFVKKGFKF